MTSLINANAARCRSQTFSWERWILSGLLVLVTLLSLAFIAADMTTSTNTTSQAAYRGLPEVQPGIDERTGLPLHWYNGDCGNSPAEAEARGCFFQMAVLTWLPKGCYTQDDIDDAEDMYRGRTDWYYEADGRNLTVDEVRRGHYHNFTSTWEMHMSHCVYTWKRLHRALLNPGMKVDAYTVNYYHSEHCAALSKSYSGGAAGETGVLFAKYPVCA